MASDFSVTRPAILKRASWIVAASALVAAVLVSAPRLRAADTLPGEISDAAFWKLIVDSSEPGGAFQSENFLSNETGFQAVIPELKQTTRPEGVYMGVGPEQNFTYISRSARGWPSSSTSAARTCCST